MLRIKLIFLFIICGLYSTHAQVLGGKMGIGFDNIQFDTLMIKNQNQTDTLTISLDNNSRVAYAGVFVRLPIGAFYLEAEPILASYRYPFRIKNTQDWNGGSIVKTERFTSLDLGLAAGVKLWNFLRLYGGIRTQIWTSYDSNVSIFIPEYNSDWEKVVNSYQAGVGLEVGRLTIDFNYEKTLNGIGDNISIFGNNYSLNATRERFSVKAGIPIIFLDN